MFLLCLIVAIGQETKKWARRAQKKIFLVVRGQVKRCEAQIWNEKATRDANLFGDIVIKRRGR